MWHLSVRLRGDLIVIARAALQGEPWGSLSDSHLSFISASPCPVEERQQYFLKSPPPLFSHIFPALKVSLFTSKTSTQPLRNGSLILKILNSFLAPFDKHELTLLLGLK